MYLNRYVHYHVPGFPDDVMTPVHLPSSNPEFQHLRSFPLSVDAEGLGWLGRQRLVFYVYDDSLDDQNEKSFGGDGCVIGTVEVPLKPLIKGDSVEGQFQIKGELSCVYYNTVVCRFFSS